MPHIDAVGFFVCMIVLHRIDINGEIIVFCCVGVTVLQSAVCAQSFCLNMSRRLISCCDPRRRALTEADAAVGPSYMWQWLSWRRLTPAQRARSAAFSQLSEFFPADKPAKSGLNHEEANGVSLSVSRAIGAEVDAEFIHETYQMMYKIHFLNLSIKSAAYCRTRYGQHERDNKACNNLACTDVLFFWRVLNMLQSSGNMLRVEAMDFKNVIEDELRLALGAIHDDKLALQDTLSSPRMDLAEDIEVVKVTLAKMRAVADKLESEGRV
eukprot:m.29246 g.29246  ORF g.29246 m.29246 type:complete len:268 (-) comp13698_c0_seq3:3131-3934(-)